MMMSDIQGQIWMDGSFCDWKEAKIHILTHTLHYGTGVFEGVRAYETKAGPAIFRLEDHTDRLFNSANFSNLKLGFPLAVKGVLILLGFKAYSALAKLKVSPLFFLVI